MWTEEGKRSLARMVEAAADGHPVRVDLLVRLLGPDIATDGEVDRVIQAAVKEAKEQKLTEVELEVMATCTAILFRQYAEVAARRAVGNPKKASQN